MENYTSQLPNPNLRHGIVQLVGCRFRCVVIMFACIDSLVRQPIKKEKPSSQLNNTDHCERSFESVMDFYNRNF